MRSSIIISALLPSYARYWSVGAVAHAADGSAVRSRCPPSVRASPRGADGHTGRPTGGLVNQRGTSPPAVPVNLGRRLRFRAEPGGVGFPVFIKGGIHGIIDRNFPPSDLHRAGVRRPLD